jgi:1,4-alpha-glucan branching enzyme
MRLRCPRFAGPIPGLRDCSIPIKTASLRSSFGYRHSNLTDYHMEMPSLGRLVFVLHGHLPYVLHHGVWPHGESWLYEGAAETYLPLLELLDELAGKKIKFGLTIGLTPVLLEQLADVRFKTGFVDYLNERMQLAQHDAEHFTEDGETDLVPLARRWEQFFQQRLIYFEKLKRDLPGTFARHFRAGRIQILTSAATHAYLPVLAEDRSIAAQLRAGMAISEKHLGVRPKGLWLPECAYRPAEEAWQPPVLYRDARPRAGLETPIAEVGVSHFFVDTHLIAQGKPMAVTGRDGTQPTNDALIFWDTKRGWGSPLDPVGIVSEPSTPKVFAFGRHPLVSEQVWSAVSGYPGADDYLEFHHKHGDHGLRYHRVTSHHSTPTEKLPYDPARVPGKIYEHAEHFCTVLRKMLNDFTKQTGRVGTIVAPFDAELFGHWWFEGVAFLRDVLLTLAHDRSIDVTTAEQALNAAVPDKVVRLPEGSWGEGGHHHVWLNEQTRWLWEAEYRAELRFRQLLVELPWRSHPKVRSMLEKAARELLLLQSSDWPFAIHSGAAADYGIARFAGHVTRFDRLATIARDIAAGRAADAVQSTEIAEADAHDVIFAGVDLNWWL